MQVRITRSLLDKLLADLRRRPIKGQFERISVAYARYASELCTSVVVINDVEPLPDLEYAKGTHGASFNSRWLVSRANLALARNQGIFLAHLHNHRGKPWFSLPDMNTNRDVMLPLSYGIEDAPYGALLCSRDDIAALVARDQDLIGVRNVTVVPQI